MNHTPQVIRDAHSSTRATVRNLLTSFGRSRREAREEQTFMDLASAGEELGRLARTSDELTIYVSLAHAEIVKNAKKSFYGAAEIHLEPGSVAREYGVEVGR